MCSKWVGMNNGICGPAESETLRRRYDPANTRAVSSAEVTPEHTTDFERMN